MRTPNSPLQKGKVIGATKSGIALWLSLSAMARLHAAMSVAIIVCATAVVLGVLVGGEALMGVSWFALYCMAAASILIGILLPVAFVLRMAVTGEGGPFLRRWWWGAANAFISVALALVLLFVVGVRTKLRMSTQTSTQDPVVLFKQDMD